MRTLRRRLCRCAVMLSVALAAACGDARVVTAPGPPAPTYQGYPGFDISHYPGDAALAAWRLPASPYHWVGYYLYAPCHRDSTWMGRYGAVTAMGWGTAVLYVGQQDWAAIPASVIHARRAVASPDFDWTMASAQATAPTCSASLLSSAQGASEAADAVAKTAGQGVPPGGSIFLDVEYVTSVSPALAAYLSAWITGVLADGRFQPALYCAKRNAADVYAIAMAAYAAAGRHDGPRFWIASSLGFAITGRPSDVGLEYANVWQGLFDVRETWGGATNTIDIDVADSPSPSQVGLSADLVVPAWKGE